MHKIILPDRAAWLDERRKGLGGSDIPAILGCSPWRTPLQVWATKVGLESENESSYVLRRGSHMEPLLWSELAREVPGLEAFPQSLVIVEGAEPWMRYSPDAFLRVGSVDALGEGKSHPRGSSKWAYGVPEHVQAQVQWGLHVCDLGIAYVAVDLGTEFSWAKIERDPAWWPAHEEIIREFWRRVVEEDAPAPTSDEGDRKVLGALYRSQTGEAKPLDGALLEDAQTYDEIVETMKALDEKKNLIVNKICAEIGTAERGVLPDGSGFSWVKQSRPKMVADPTQPRSEFRVVRRFGKNKGE